MTILAFSRKSTQMVGAPKRVSSLYRSATYPAGATRRVGNMHMHLDCSKSAGSEKRMIEVAQVLEGRGWPSKVSRINLAKPGLDISNPEYADEYLRHTPELCADENTFTAYLTTLLAPNITRADDVEALHKQARINMSANLRGFSKTDAVVEIERVVALIGVDSIEVASPGVVPIGNKASLFEIHHFVDIPHAVPLEFDEWQALCNLSGIVVGGWFQFDKEKDKALRSVKFSKNPDMIQLIAETRELARVVGEHADIEPKDVHVQTVVEQIIDIWRVT